MAIARERLEGMNFRDVATGRRLAPVHPGDVLMKDFIEPMGITRYKVAKLAGMQQRRIDEICAGNRSITGDTALRLARLFGIDAAFWMNLQAQYDLETADRELHRRIETEVTPLATAQEATARGMAVRLAAAQPTEPVKAPKALRKKSSRALAAA